MGDRATGKEDIRKIERTGRDGASYMITIPRAIIEDLGWQEREKVTVKRNGRKIVIENWQG